MNINAKELLMLDKARLAKMQARQEQPTTPTESGVTNPQDGMKVLEMQANYNIGFQGVKERAAKEVGKVADKALQGAGKKAGNKLRSIMAALMLATAGGATMTTTTSCDINMAYIEEPDNSAELALLAQILEAINKGNEIDQDILDTIREQAKKDDAYRETALNYFLNDETTQEKLGEILYAIKDELEKGKISDQDALDKILDALGDINDSVIMVGDKIDSLADDVNAFHNDYLEGNAKLGAGIDEINAQLKDVVKNGEINHDKLDQIIANQDKTNEKLDSLYAVQIRNEQNLKGLQATADELKEIAEDPARFDELIRTIKETDLNDEDYAKFQEMFNTLGIDIVYATKMSAVELKQTIEKFENTYLKTEKEKSELVKSVITKVDLVNANIKNLTDAQAAQFEKLMAGFGSLEDIINDKADTAIAELRDIDAVLDAVLGMLQNIYTELQSIGDDVETLKEGQVVVNQGLVAIYDAIVANGKANSAELNKVNEQLAKSNETLAGLKANTDSLIVIANDPTRHNELIETIKSVKLGDEDFAKFQAMFDAMGLELSDVINISGEELEKRIINFQKTYVAKEDEKLALGQSIADKLDAMSGQLDANQKAMLTALKSHFNKLMKNDNANTDELLAELRDIDAALDNIQATLNNIYTELQSIGDDVEAIKEGQVVVNQGLVAIYDAVVANGKANSAELNKVNEQLAKSNETLTKVENNTYSLIEIAKDPTRFNELKALITTLKPEDIDYARFESMFKAMGLELSDVINMNGSQLASKVENFNNDVVVIQKESLEVQKSIADMLKALPDQLTATQKDMLAELQADFQALLDNDNANAAANLAELNKINEQLAGIQGTLNAMYTTMLSMNDKLDDYAEGQKATNETLVKIFEQGNVHTAYLDQLLVGQRGMAEDIKKIEQEAYSILNQVKTNHSEFMDGLKSLEPESIDYAKFEAMFEKMGTSINNVQQMTANQLEAALKSFIDTYVATEKANAEMLGDIYDAIKEDVTVFPNVDLSGVEQAIANLENAMKDTMNNNTAKINDAIAGVQGELNGIRTDLAAIYTQLVDNAKMAATYADKHEAKMDQSVKELKDALAELKDGLANNNGGNATVDLSEVVQQQKYTNNYLNSLNQKADVVIEQLKELAELSGGALTAEQLDQVLTQHDIDNRAAYAEMLDNLDIKPADNTKVENLLAEINTKLDARKDYTEYLNVIINKLNSIDFSIQANADKLDEISAKLDNIDFSVDANTQELVKIQELIEVLDGCCCDNEGTVNPDDLGNLDGLV